MMSRAEISVAASAMANQLRAGIPINKAFGQIGRLQPKHQAFWAQARTSLERGARTSDVLADVWPDSLVTALKAGEQAGKLNEVFAEIERTIEIENTVLSMVRKLAYPLGLTFTGFLVFCGFMAFVLPGIGKAVPQKDKGMIFHLAELFEMVLKNYWWAVMLVFAGVAYAIYSWLSTPSGRRELLDAVVRVPLLHDAMRDLYFGLWANQMALMSNAGISTVAALEITSSTLPKHFQDGVLALKFDISLNNRNMADAVDPDKQEPDDPRLDFPFYITNAFMVAEQTGEVDRELLRVAPSLLSDGMKRMGKIISLANMGATVLAAFFITAPLGAYYTQVFTGLNSL